MTTFVVADICENHTDSTGAPVLTVYAKVSGVYAVYRTATRVMVHFADDDALGAEQRRALIAMAVVRGEISSGTEELRASRNEKNQLRAERFDRRLAEALVLALIGQSEQALATLEQVRKDLRNERESSARFLYLLFASGAVALLITIFAIVTSDIWARQFDADAETLWFAAGAGAVGAFFSIAIAIRSRSVKPELINRDNIMDAILRVVVGAIAAVLLVSLAKSGAVSLEIGGALLGERTTLSDSQGGWQLVLIVAFIAGFIERLVPDLIERSVVTSATPAVAETAAAKADVAERNERSPLGEANAAPPADTRAKDSTEIANDDETDSGEDFCVEHGDDEEQPTLDEELPPAAGGVEPAR